MRYDAEHKQRTRSRVLQEAARAIREEGPHRVGVAGVMARAGLTHGGFYAHFASKDELLLHAVDQMFDEGLAYFDKVTAGQPPAEALRRYIAFYLSPRHRDAIATGCAVPCLAADLPRLDRPVRRRFEHGVERLSTALAGPLQALGHADAPALASSVLAELAGALALARAVASAEASNALLERSRAQLLARLGIQESPLSRLRERG